MKLYYYCYETCVHRPWFKANGDSDTSYDLYEGYILETPLGFLELSEDCLDNNWDNLIDFTENVQTKFPRNFGIVELK